MGFKSDQFYGIKGNVASNGIGSRDDDLTFTNRNPRFAYPGSLEGSVSKDGKWTKHLVQRGFMKVLPQTKSGQAINSKWASSQLFFQFNPQTIRRSVALRSDFMNPLLQDPGQFILPVPGNMNFTFDLMFDRSMELNSTVDVSNSWWASDSPMLQPTVTTSSRDPGQLGVLVDMNLLDQIVGQGISKDMIDYIIERGNVLYSQQVAESTTTATAEDGTTTTTSSLPEWDEAKVRSALDNNVGNQAFLIPNPVRVVFSSLFMVDGYVESMDVAYVKFTQTMIPQQVVISVTMQAMYLGFARAKTFLTTALENAEPAVLNDPSSPPASTSSGEARKKVEELLSMPGANIKKFSIMPRSAAQSSPTLKSMYPQEQFGSFVNSTSHNGPEFTDPKQYDDDSYLDLTWTKQIQSKEGYGYYPFIVRNPKTTWSFGFPDVSKNDPIQKALASGSTDTISGISLSWTMQCYRKQMGLSGVEGEESTSGEFDVELFSYTYDSGIVTTEDAWKKLKTQLNTEVENLTYSAKSGTPKQAARLYVTTRMSDSGWKDQSLNTLWKLDTRGYLPVKWSLTVTVTALDSEGKNITYSGSLESLVKLDDCPDFDIDLAIQ